MAIVFLLGLALFGLSFYSLLRPLPKVGLASTRNSLIAGGVGMVLFLLGASGLMAPPAAGNGEPQVTKATEEAPPATGEADDPHLTMDEMEKMPPAWRAAREAWQEYLIETRPCEEQLDRLIALYRQDGFDPAASQAAGAKVVEWCTAAHEGLVEELNGDWWTNEGRAYIPFLTRCSEAYKGAVTAARALAIPIEPGSGGPARVARRFDAAVEAAAATSEPRNVCEAELLEKVTAAGYRPEQG